MPTSWGCALSSTAAKTPPSHPWVIHRSTRGRGSPSKNITGLKTSTGMQETGSVYQEDP